MRLASFILPGGQAAFGALSADGTRLCNLAATEAQNLREALHRWGVEGLRQTPAGQAVDIHQMVEAVDAGRGEGVGKQRRRQRSRDVCADQSDQHAARAHAVFSVSGGSAVCFNFCTGKL